GGGEGGGGGGGGGAGEQPPGLPAAGQEVGVRAPEPPRNRPPPRRAACLHEKPSVLEGQLVGLPLLERRPGGPRCDLQERGNRVVRGGEDRRDDRRRRQRAARDRTLGKRRVPERHFDLLERHAGLRRAELRQDRVRP